MPKKTDGSLALAAEPRTLAERFRLYRVRAGEFSCVASTPDAGGVGLALVTLCAEGEIAETDRVGLLDTFPDGKPAPTGRWLVSPFAKGGV